MVNFSDSSLEELQQTILSRSWYDNPIVIDKIVDRFTQLQSEHSDLQNEESIANFGTVEFWDAFYENRENGTASFTSNQPSSIYEWQNVVEMGNWKGNPQAIDRLFDQYLDLVKGGMSMGREFGTSEFWNEFGKMISFGQDEIEWTDQEAIQVGRGNDSEEEFSTSHYFRLDPVFMKTSRRFGTNYGQYNFR